MRIPIHVSLNLNVRGLKPSATLRINERTHTLILDGRKICRLGFGQSPFPVPEPIVEALRENAHQKAYLPVKGLLELREAVAAYTHNRQNVPCTAEDVLIGPGSKELLFLLQLVYYGDLVIPQPSWVSYSPQAQIIGRQVRWIPTRQENDWKLMPEELEELCEQDPDRPRIVVLNYPSNPTGGTYSTSQLKRIARIARKYQVILLADEIYGELHHQGKHDSLARYYPEGTIISSGLSKWCGAGGWRLGYFVFPAGLSRLLNAMAVAASETFTSTSAPIQYAAVRAFDFDGEIEEYLAHVRKILKFLGQQISGKLTEYHIQHPRPEGGFYLYPNFSLHADSLRSRNIRTSEALCEQLLMETGVALLPASDFGSPPEVLAARLSYVDFDGAAVLELSRSYGERPFDDQFLKIAFGEMMESIERMCVWVKN